MKNDGGLRMLHRVERMADYIRRHHAWFFTHVKRDGNRVADLMANIGERMRERFMACQLHCSHLATQDMDHAKEFISSTRHVSDYHLEVQTSHHPTSSNYHSSSFRHDSSIFTLHQDQVDQCTPLIAINEEIFPFDPVSDE